MRTHAHTQTHKHTLTAVLEALFDLYIRSPFQNPIRLKSPEAEQSNRGDTEEEGRGRSEVREQKELNKHNIHPCTQLELCSGVVGAQESVSDMRQVS